jgi:SNF2 family DNA or RNA helicase
MYEFKTEPFDHQREAFVQSYNKLNWAYFMEMGCGKSKVLIDNMAWLYEEGEIDTAVIVAPKGVYRNWVLKEIPIHLPDRIEHSLITWRASANKAQKKELEEAATMGGSNGLRILVVNVEAFATEKVMRYLRSFLHDSNFLLTVDESTTIKNPKAKRTKQLTAVGKAATYKRILTGSPVTKSPMDLYAQCAFLGDDTLGFTNYYAYQNRYAVTRRQRMGAHTFEQIIGYRNMTELAGKLKGFSSRVLKKDCLDLPEKTYSARYVSLSPEQLRHYNTLKNYALAILEEGQVTAPQVMTQLVRLQQLLCGYLVTDDGETVEVPSRRMDAMLDTVEEMDGKIIIWSRFRNDIQRITEALKKKYGENSAGSYYGDTSDDDREKLVQNFSDPEHETRFFVGNPQTAGYGLTLVSATNVIYYANDFNLETRVQSEDRCHRIGQTKAVTYVDLISEGTVDEYIVKALTKKIDLAGAALGEEVKEWLKL